MKVRVTLTFEYEAQPQNYGLDSLTIEDVRAVDTLDSMIEALTYLEEGVTLTLEEVND